MKYKKTVIGLVSIIIFIFLFILSGFNKVVYAAPSSSNGLGTRNDVIEGNKGGGITDSTVDKDGNNLKARMNGNSLNGSTGEIDYKDLVYLQIPHYDFSGNVTTGEMVVNVKIADEVLLIFQELYQVQYPIKKMVLVDQYYSSGDSDFASIEDNNTSAFNERTTDSGGPSNHAKGLAIDINPLINPMIYGEGDGRYSTHTGSALYVTDRIEMTNWDEKAKAACINPNTDIYRIFTSHGWRWLGDANNNTGDTQHFDKQNPEGSATIDNSNDSSDSNGSKDKKIPVIDTLGDLLRKGWETIITFFENMHTGREEEGINYALFENMNNAAIDADGVVGYAVSWVERVHYVLRKFRRAC